MTEPADDPYISERIRRALADDDRIGDLDVQVVVRAGRVVLSGNVAGEGHRDEVTELVARLVPDLEVCSEIDVMQLETPGPEEHLR